MNESIHGERTASEPQDRVTELIEQQTAISQVLRAIANSPHDLQPFLTDVCYRAEWMPILTVSNGRNPSSMSHGVTSGGVSLIQSIMNDVIGVDD
jgi:hypothetical protein